MEGLDEMEDFLLNLKYKWKCKPYSNKWRQEERKSEKHKEKFIFVFFPANKSRFSCRVWCGVCWPIWLPKPVCRNDWGSVQKSEWIVIIFVSIFIKIGIHWLNSQADAKWKLLGWRELLLDCYSSYIKNFLQSFNP